MEQCCGPNCPLKFTCGVLTPVPQAVVYLERQFLQTELRQGQTKARHDPSPIHLMSYWKWEIWTQSHKNSMLGWRPRSGLCFDMATNIKDGPPIARRESWDRQFLTACGRSCPATSWSWTWLRALGEYMSVETAQFVTTALGKCTVTWGSLEDWHVDWDGVSQGHRERVKSLE